MNGSKVWLGPALVAIALVGGEMLAGCSSSDPTPRGGRDAAATTDAAHSTTDATSPTDGGILIDAQVADSGTSDSGPRDSGSVDATLTADAGPTGVGMLFGTCGVLGDAELSGAEPSRFENRIDFPNGFPASAEAQLTPGAQQILQEGTAGGSSGLSEAFAFEVLARCEGAQLIKTETEIVYDDPQSKKTDISVDIDGYRIGVSVTRAVGFPRDAPYPVSRAQDLLNDKLADILNSSMNVNAQDAWTKQILHVIAYADQHAEAVATAAETVNPAIRADTILWVTITDGDDAFLY